MKRLVAALSAGVLLVVLGSGTVLADPKLLCFTGGAAGCMVAPNGTVSLTNITVGGVDYAGVYLNSRSNSGKALGKVSFSFDYDINAVAGGAPRLSIPIDDRVGTAFLYVFLDALNCGNTGTVSTTLATCPVYLNQPSGTTTGPWDNWADFAADPATARWRIKPGGIPFIIADWPSGGSAATYTIWNIALR